MKKILLVVGALAVALGVYFFFFNTTTVDYTAEVANEVSELETELAALDAQVTAGTLTPEAAAEAQTKIYARIDTINEALASGNGSLSDAQRQTIADGLAQLHAALLKYKDTLAVIDAQVATLPADKQPRRYKGSGSLSAAIAETIAAGEVAAEVDVTEDTTDVVSDEDSSDDTASSTEDASDDTASSTEEDADEADDTVSDDDDTASSTDDTASDDDTTTAVETETEMEVSAQ